MEITASQLVNIGEQLHLLRYPASADAQCYLDTPAKLRSALRSLGMPAAADAGSSLCGVQVVAVGSQMAATPAAQLGFAASTLASVLYEEARHVRLRTVDCLLPPAVDQFPTKVQLEPHQHSNWQDLKLCLQSGAYRPAIVMGWTLAFDVIRSWVFRDAGRLAEFNAQLQQRTQRQNRGPRTIVDYRDFFKEQEGFVLDLCRLGNGPLTDFTDKTHRRLQSLLDERNTFAHANYDQASSFTAKAYVERALTTACGAPFS